jgi:hypothetical protein
MLKVVSLNKKLRFKKCTDYPPHFLLTVSSQGQRHGKNKVQLQLKS